MPYAGPNDRTLPDAVKQLPADLRKTWVDACMSAYRNGKSEEAAFRAAWGAVKAHRANLEGVMPKQKMFAITNKEPFEKVQGLDVFKKELISEGKWKHPKQHFVVDVTPQRLEHWRDTFADMKAKGRRVTLPPGHHNRFEPDKNFGFIDKMTVETRPDGRQALFGFCDIPNPTNSAKIGTTILGTSIGIDPHIVDGFGEWRDAIDHNALTNDEVVGDAAGFRRVLDTEHSVEYEILYMEAIDPKAKVRNRPEPVFDANSKNVTDNKDHFPINTIGRARNALARAAHFVKIGTAPKWFEGSLKSFIDTVRRAVKRKYPSIGVTGLEASVYHATIDLSAAASPAGDVAMDMLKDAFRHLAAETEGDKKSEFLAVLDDVRDLVAPALTAQLEAVEDFDETAAILGLEGDVMDLTALTTVLDAGDMKPEDLIAKAVTTIKELRGTNKQLEARVPQEAPEPTAREIELEARVKTVELEAAKTTAASDAALLSAASGKFSKPAEDAVKALLGVRGATTLNLDTNASDPVDVRGLALTILKETPDGAALDPQERLRNLQAIGDVRRAGTDEIQNMGVEDIKKADVKTLSALSAEQFAALSPEQRVVVAERINE